MVKLSISSREFRIPHPNVPFYALIDPRLCQSRLNRVGFNTTFQNHFSIVILPPYLTSILTGSLMGTFNLSSMMGLRWFEKENLPFGPLDFNPCSRTMVHWNSTSAWRWLVTKIWDPPPLFRIRNSECSMTLVYRMVCWYAYCHCDIPVVCGWMIDFIPTGGSILHWPTKIAIPNHFFDLKMLLFSNQIWYLTSWSLFHKSPYVVLG